MLIRLESGSVGWLFDAGAGSGGGAAGLGLACLAFTCFEAARFAFGSSTWEPVWDLSDSLGKEIKKFFYLQD